MFRLRPFFRYSTWDAIPAVCGVGILALFVWTFLWFDQLAWWLLVPAFIAVAWSYCWNLQCISHNFIHTQFFRSGALNRGYSLFLTLLIGIPQGKRYGLNRSANSGQASQTRFIR
jgi:fatty acid desaturase